MPSPECTSQGSTGEKKMRSCVSNPPGPEKVSKMSTAALVTAIAGLISALAAFSKPADETKAETGYVVLVKAMDSMAKENDQVRKDLLDLRTTFAEYVKAKEGPHSVETANLAPRDVVPELTVRVVTGSSDLVTDVPEVTDSVVLPSIRKTVVRPKLPSLEQAVQEVSSE